MVALAEGHFSCMLIIPKEIGPLWWVHGEKERSAQHDVENEQHGD
jgi:hypothetical protein